MKVNFYLLPLILFLCVKLGAQDCTALNFTYTTTESRCVATGSITVNASGGSGNYTYKATGPVSPPSTSSNVITGLAPGFYSIQVKDISTGCTRQIDNIQVKGDYDDPRFQLTKTDAGCSGNDGTISAINVQYGRSPFSYTIVAPSPSSIGATSPTGSFSGLVPGEYSIELKDSCGGIQVRKITIENYDWWFDSLSVVRNGCEWADVYIRVKDNKGHINTAGAGLPGFMYGYVMNGNDTTWYPLNEFSVFLGTQRYLTIVVRDNCGNVHSTLWQLPANLKPSLGSVSLTNLGCTTFSASVTGQNLTNPSFCLYDSVGNSLGCNGSGSFSNIPYGSYCIKATDACYDTTITRCFTLYQPTPSVAPSVQITNENCSTFTATITGQQNLTSPLYCLYDVNGVSITCNPTGVFTNVPYGTYCIKVDDNCVDTLITRCFTAARPTAILSNYTISGSTCSGFNVVVTGNNLNNPTYCLFDSLGNVVACNSTGDFSGIGHGYYCIKAISCGDTTNSVCFGSSRPIPSLGSVQITNRQCSTFTATVGAQQNLTNPQFCLYDNNDLLLQCNSNGVFTGLAYGSYCIKMVNTCYDTTITRCFTEAQPRPSLNSTLQLLSSNCTTVSFKVNGSNLNSPNYCLFDASDNQLACNSTGTFNNYPYGTYCVKVTDGCYDTTMTVCRTFAPVRGVSLTSTKPCTIGDAYVDVTFTNGNSPYTVNVYHPDGSLVLDSVANVNPLRLQLPALPAGAQYKVVGTDGCGNKDSASIAPNANIVTKNASVRAKCPSSVWLNGAGDILASCTSNFHSVSPRIIKKNGVSFITSYSSVTAGTYTFADLEPAVYIVEYTQQTCNAKVYDTVTVPPYAYPSQGQSAIYQCDNNSFSLGADVQGGVSPYSYQIIGSTPASPSITTSVQNSAVFTINNGTVYSLVRLRTIDACGNATLSDVSVLPLQNISISASNTCFFQNVVLSADTIPNATYIWYKRTTLVDSVLLDTSLTFNLPFFQPEEMGQYICKVIVNNGCVTRLSYFNLDGQCFHEVLPLGFELNGRKAAGGHQLYWTNSEEKGVLKYILERKRAGEASFRTLATVNIRSGGNYSFNDNNPGAGRNEYRLKVIYASKYEYTNVVALRSDAYAINVYPNPVKDVWQVSISSETPSSYRMELLNTSGQSVHRSEIKNTASTVVTYERKNLPPGIYLLRVTDIGAGTTEIRKLVFE